MRSLTAHNWMEDWKVNAVRRAERPELSKIAFLPDVRNWKTLDSDVKQREYRHFCTEPNDSQLILTLLASVLCSKEEMP